MTDPRLQEAAQLRLAEDFAAAEALCHDVLASDPGNAGAMAIVGICAVERGDVTGGRDWLDRAEAADATLASLHLYRSIERAASDDLDGAIASARRATELAPGRLDVWGRLGDLAGQAGDFETSAKAFVRALEAEPEHPAAGPVALRLAAALSEAGDLNGVGAALDQAEACGLAEHGDVLRLRAGLARHHGDWTAMKDFAERWLAVADDDAEASSAYAHALSQLGYYKKAAAIFKPVVEADPSAANWAAQGRLILGGRAISRAEGCFRKAQVIDPECAAAVFGLARIYTFSGKIEMAEKACRKVLALDPGNLEAYGQLCEVSGGRLTDDELAALEAAVSRPGLAADQLAIGLFALGDALHRRKRPAEAFAAWSRANDTKKLQHNGAVVSAYDREAQSARTDWLIDHFDTDVAGENMAGGEGAVPIFIVGMPRSGTTLIEAAIAAHDDVLPGGELSALPFVFEEFMVWARQSGWRGGLIPEDRLAIWRERYRAQHREFGLDGARFVTDKQPSNFLAVGLIRQLFPAAPVIHIRRRPVETAFSIFRRNFSRQWPFAHDLGDIAHYYAEQSRLCAHWETVLPKPFTLIQYEDLVRDFEARLRYVIARCGITWDRKCLEFYKVDRSVMTFSAVQVRKPPSADHLDSTSPYANELAGFDDRIAALGVDPETGAWGVSVHPAEETGGEKLDAPRRAGFWSRLTGRGDRR